MSTPARPMSTLKTRVKATRDSRRRQLRTARQLAQYYTPTDRVQIDDIIAAYTPEHTRQTQHILVRQRAN